MVGGIQTKYGEGILNPLCLEELVSYANAPAAVSPSAYCFETFLCDEKSYDVQRPRVSGRIHGPAK
jgi:hypothetical protein